MSILKELVKISEAISVADEPTAADLYKSLENMLHEAEDKLKHQAGKASSYNIGGSMYANVSGDVSLQKNFVHHSAYLNTQWDLALKVGNNIQGKALDEVKKIYNECKEEAENHGPTKMESHGDVFHAYFDDGSVSCKYEYARSFCWVAIRYSKKK